MPRRPSGLPTSIYWLIDASGRPFYCGKTVYPLEKRLAQHRHAARQFPHRKLSQRIAAAGAALRVHVVEVVPLHGDWSAREKRWITILRASFPGCVNISSGGQGSPGNVHSATTRARIGVKLRGRILSTETRKRISDSRLGVPHKPETAEAIRSKLRGIIRTPAQRAKTSAAMKRWHAENRARNVKRKRRRRSAEIDAALLNHLLKESRTSREARLALIAAAGLRPSWL